MRIAPAIVLAATLASAGPALAADPDWTKVDQAFGRSGAAMPGDVHRYGFPRSDLHVTVDGVTLLPAFALGGWLAFKADGDGAMVMGDLVLTEDEINPVMSKLLAGGIAVTAVHNHLLRSQPATFYMHVDGHGDATALATTLHDALAASHTPLGAPGAAASTKPDLDVEPDRAGARTQGQCGRRRAAIRYSARRRHRRSGHDGASCHGHGDRGQLPTHRWRQGGDHRRLRPGGRRGGSRCSRHCVVRASR